MKKIKKTILCVEVIILLSASAVNAQQIQGTYPWLLKDFVSLCYSGAISTANSEGIAFYVVPGVTKITILKYKAVVSFGETKKGDYITTIVSYYDNKGRLTGWDWDSNGIYPKNHLRITYDFDNITGVSYYNNDGSLRQKFSISYNNIGDISINYHWYGTPTDRNEQSWTTTFPFYSGAYLSPDRKEFEYYYSNGGYNFNGRVYSSGNNIECLCSNLFVKKLLGFYFQKPFTFVSNGENGFTIFNGDPQNERPLYVIEYTYN